MCGYISYFLVCTKSFVPGPSYSLTITKAVSTIEHCWFYFEVISHSKDEFARNI